MKEATKISAKYLATAVTKLYIREEIKKGRSSEEIQKSFTKELLTELGRSFCEKNNFQLID